MDNLYIKEMTAEELKELVNSTPFKEDKYVTTKLLFEAVKSSRAFQNLKDMYYEDNGDRENVVLCFKYKDGYKEEIPVNVTCDSCIALIYDVVNALHNMV